MKVIDIPQGTPEWLEGRAGKVTASRVADVLAKIKSGEAASRRDYRAQLVAEILTGKPQGPVLNTPDILWGQQQELFARAAYEADRDVMVDQVGLVLHPTIERGAASPDGLVDDDGLVEIKCPKTATHLDYILAEVVPPRYIPQMVWQMACTERRWCDFVSFDPRLTPALQLFCVRLHRDDELIKVIENEVVTFIAEVEETVAQLNARSSNGIRP